jgi:hypothetical protein
MPFGIRLPKSPREAAAGTHNIAEERLRRAREVSEQPWGRFLLGIVIRIAVVFAVAATVITVIQLLRG